MAVLVRRRDGQTRPTSGWSPFGELEELQQRMGELMQTAMSGAEVAAPWIPDVDIEESDDAWVLEAEIPGAQKGDVNVEVNSDNEVVISGDIKEKERAGILRRRTRRVGQFEFRVTLPGQISADGIDADLKHGVLTVRIPKAEQAGSRRIEIHDRADDAGDAR
jgi:HSP20 family protein